MGSSDPLPPGFEIRFGSLNFQATGNGYLMRLTNREELHARCQDGSVPVNASRVAATPTPASTDAAGPSAPRRRRRSGQRSRQARTERRHAARVASKRDALSGETTTAQMGGAIGLRTALPHQSARHYDGVRRLRQRQRGNAQGSARPPCPGRQGPQHLRRRRVIPRLRRRAATRHFARIRGVGLFRCARLSDVPAIPRSDGLLVLLL
jgi:hypothetical protein